MNVTNDGKRLHGPLAARPAFLALSCVGFIASTAPALAQATNGDSGDKDVKLGGVVVTDTAIEDQGYKVDKPASPKYTAPLLNTPKSVVILPAQVIQESGSTTFVDALRTVPGITFGAGEGGNPQGDRPFIRGLDAQGSTYIDGIRSVGGQSREIFAIEQIEVTKGSDSTMGGRGGAGGSLNLVSKMPRLRTELIANASVGTDDYKRVTVDGNYQIGSTAAVRLNAMWHDQDVAGRDKVNFSRWGISPSVGFGIDTPTRAYLNYYHMQSDDLPDPGIPFERTQAQAVASGQLNIGPAEVVQGQRIRRGTFYGLVDRDFRKTNVDEVLFRFEHDLNDTLSSRITAKYSNAKQAYIISQPDDSQGNVQNGKLWRRANTRYSDVDAFGGQASLFGSFDTGSIRHSFSVGLEASWEESRRATYTVNTGSTALPGVTPAVSLTGGANPTFTSRRCNTAGAAATATTEVGAGSNYNCTSIFNPNPNDPWINYAADGVTPTPIVRNPISALTEATTYAAYLFDTVTLTEQLLINLGLRYERYSTSLKAFPATATSNLSLKDEFLNYQVGVVFKPIPSASLYASYATSTSPAGTLVGEGQDGNAIAAATINDLKAEKTRSYEVGAKAELFDAALGLSLALFRTETDNARTTGSTGLLEYVGERRIEGVEVGFNGRILPFWSVFGGYTYMDSEVKNAGLNNVANGQPFPNTPKHSFTSWTTVDLNKVFQIGGGAIYNSRQYGGFGASGVSRSIPGYWRFDATVAANFNENVSLRVNVQNVANKRYYDRTYSTHFVTMAAGRSAFATLGVKY